MEKWNFIVALQDVISEQKKFQTHAPPDISIPIPILITWAGGKQYHI